MQFHSIKNTNTDEMQAYFVIDLHPLIQIIEIIWFKICGLAEWKKVVIFIKIQHVNERPIDWIQRKALVVDSWLDSFSLYVWFKQISKQYGTFWHAIDEWIRPK